MIVISIYYMSASGSEVTASRVFLMKKGDLNVHKDKIYRKKLEVGRRSKRRVRWWVWSEIRKLDILEEKSVG